MFVLFGVFGLYIDVLSVSMRFSVVSFSVYMNIFKIERLDVLEKIEMLGFSKNGFCYFKFKIRADMLSIEYRRRS